MTTETSPIFAGLNTEQRCAVETLEGPLLILAGAGSGKTRTLTHRIAHLIARGVPAWQILAVTFTNKAANEMKERIARILHIATGEEASAVGTTTHPSLPLSGTFHSLCARILRRDIESLGRERSFVIYDTDDQDKLMTDVLRSLHIAKEELKPRTALSVISGWKSEGVGTKDIAARATNPREAKIAEIYAVYQKRLLEANAMDFDDLLLETVRLFRECPAVLERYQRTWRYLHVDEYQDTNHVQYAMISMLANAHHNICVIGDPDQSIYAFRGADIRNILNFQKEYPGAVAITLERNYRSTQQVLDAAGGVIARNPKRPPKSMWTDRTDGAKVRLQEVSDERREAEEAVRLALQRRAQGMALSEQVILYRTNAQSRQFEEACMRAGVPYRILGGMKFYARREVKDLLGYLFVILNPNDTMSLLRIINVPARKIGDTTIGRLQQFCSDRSLTLWQGLRHLEMVEGLSEPVRERLLRFATIIDEGRRKAESAPVSSLAAWIMERTGMEAWLRDGTEEGETRWENVRELLTVTQKYDTLPPQESLTSFLEEVALISEVDKLQSDSRDALTLMTLHLCKGLEFRSVTIAGCEEGLLPHSSSLLNATDIEEERRLLYVGMTRAKDELALLHTVSRSQWGKTSSNHRSRFLDDIPHEVIAVQSEELSSKYGWLSAPRSGSPWQRSQHSRQQENDRHDDAPDDINQDWLEHVEHTVETGTIIEHRTMGRGTVIERHGDVVAIRFENGTTKRFALGVAPIRVVSPS